MVIVILNPRQKGEEFEEKAVEKRLTIAKKAVQAEAQELLNLIAKKEAEYFSIHGTYAGELQEIGVTLPAGSKYVYTIERADRSGFVASAKGNIDNDPLEDFWIIDQRGKLQHIIDDARN